ncbi:hypothetical protein SK069_02950 [Patulibacter brassicae]|jgi:hypothetical protein|uniref:DUF1844 domain-containing protein n=1 Tax=Patulibacter brassicae TaxID=1705717 RepID=A0ABU4VFG1_9ACTN|nr:hypothetical protein [Patulibacter brassicae]MDX8150538.1 hypothetical protein [Patulibacter brassicae]
MSSNDPFAGAGPGGQPTQEQLLAAYEEQMRSLRVEDVVVQSIAGLLEVGGRRAGLAGGGPGEADAAQLGLAIEAVKALKPIAAPLLGPNAGQIDQALSQLQLAYSRLAGSGDAAGDAGDAAPAPDGDPSGPLGADVSPKAAPDAAGGPPPAQQPGQPQQPGAVESGRLWIPGR